MKASKSLMKRAIEEIKAVMQDSRFDSNNSIWHGGEYIGNSYGYGVENYGEWEADTADNEGNQEDFLGSSEVSFIDDVMEQFNSKYPTLNCHWQEDSANMISVFVGSK